MGEGGTRWEGGGDGEEGGEGAREEEGARGRVLRLQRRDRDNLLYVRLWKRQQILRRIW